MRVLISRHKGITGIQIVDMNTPYDKMAARSPYDECVDWVSEQFRIVSEKLPTERMGSSYGLATSVAAKALRARLLLYAAFLLYSMETRNITVTLPTMTAPY